jgi:beta-lactamase regulating signal transducer with metallopeptidase domain
VAVAVPFRGGRVVVSKAMLAALNPAERGALLAHERAHLRCRHGLFLTAAALSTLLNPLLWPLRSAMVYALERWADEAAAERVGDRRLVASAVAKAALASRGRAAGALAAAGGPVPQRVRALLTEPAPGCDWQFVAALCAATTIAVTAWSAQASIEAVADLHAGIEAASFDHHDERLPTE